MQKFDVWYRLKYDGRAPEYAFLEEDYKYVGVVKAESLVDLKTRISTQKRRSVEENLDYKAFQIGDVVRAPDGKHWVYTPTGAWARVKAFGEPIRD